MLRRPLPVNIARANPNRSTVRLAVEHVFAGEKHSIGLPISTIGTTHARVKIGLASLDR